MVIRFRYHDEQGNECINNVVVLTRLNIILKISDKMIKIEITSFHTYSIHLDNPSVKLNAIKVTLKTKQANASTHKMPCIIIRMKPEKGNITAHETTHAIES